MLQLFRKDGLNEKTGWDAFGLVRIMKQKLKYFICILLLGIAANIAADEPAMEQKSLIGLPVISSETLVIALRKDLPPMSFLNVEGQPVGLFVDLWKLWSEKTGHKINFRITDWQDTVDSLKKGDADIHGAIYYSEDRSEWMAFSQPVYEFSLCFFFSKKHGEVLNINQLDGQKIGAIGGSYQEEKLRKHYPGIEIVPFTSIKDMIHSAREGEIRAFISTPATITVMLTQLGFTGEFESNDEKLFARKLHAGVLKDNQELLFLVDNGLDLISNRELAEIEQRWVPDPDKRYYRTHSYSTLEGGIGDVIRLTAAEEAWLKAHKTVKISIPAVFPPLMFPDETKGIQGMVPDYLNLFSKRTGIDFEAVHAQLSELQELIQTRRTDMFPAYMNFEPNRFISLTDSCFTLSWVIVNRMGAPFLRDVKDLALMKVSMVKNISIYEQVKKDYPNIYIYPAENPIDAMKSVSSGDTDAFVGSFIVAGYAMQKYQFPDLKIAGHTEYEDFLLKFAVRNDWPELVSILNKVIASITPPEHDQIFHKWMPVRYEQAADWRTVIKWTLWVGGVLSMISGLMLFWNRKLAKEILQRSKVEIALRESEVRFRNLFEQAAVGVAQIDSRTGRFVRINQKYCDIIGYTREEMEHIAFQTITHPEDLPADLANRERLIAGEIEETTTKKRYFRKDGATVWVNLTISPMWAPGAQHDYYIAIVQDISKLKQIEDAQSFLLQAIYTGGEFFESLARYLAENLGMDYVCIDRLKGDHLAAQTVAVFFDGKFKNNMEYTLKETPCGDVVGKAICSFPSDVRHKFPHDVALQEMMAESYVGATLWSSLGKPIGLIAIIGRHPMVDSRLRMVELVLKLVAVRAAGELERLDVEESLRTSLAEKEVLLKEVHHRVKNNLAAIMGLLDLQGQSIVDEPARAAMAELSNRIRSMSLIHEQLYQSEDFSRIDFQDYLESLVNHLHLSYQRSGNIHVSVAAKGVKMGLDNAVPCGLLITELVTNAFKYAFPASLPCSGAGRCEIAVSAECDGITYTLTVADNGVGLPAGLDWTNTKTMGLLLVKMLGEHQLQGRIEVDCTNGTTFRLRFESK